MSSLKKIKKELFYIRKAFVQYDAGFVYLKNKYTLAPRILQSKKVFEKPVTHSDLAIHMLTCHRDIIITIWSLASFYHFSKVIGKLYIHNDGSLTPHDTKLLTTFFPSITIVETSAFMDDFDKELEQYPIIKKFRGNFKQFGFKKIIDPYFVSVESKKLILDADIIWLKNPQEIKSAVESGIVTLMQQNNSEIFVSLKDGTIIDPQYARYNAGIIYYDADNFDIERFQEFLEKLDTDKDHNLHFVDQLGHAYCLKNLQPLPSTYTIANSVDDATVARHYTGPKRALMYIEGITLLSNILKQV